MELTTTICTLSAFQVLFMMSKIQNLNGTHNYSSFLNILLFVVYDVKDTKFEWNSQLRYNKHLNLLVVYDVKDTKFEWNSQLPSSNCIISSSCL